MADANDMDLLQEFAQTQSEAAFAELVRRHLNARLNGSSRLRREAVGSLAAATAVGKRYSTVPLGRTRVATPQRAFKNAGLFSRVPLEPERQ